MRSFRLPGIGIRQGQTGIKRPFSAAHGMGKMIILIPLSCSPYGEYVMVEQQPSAFEGELANRHYRIEEPKRNYASFVPEIVENEQTGEENVLDETGSSYFRYNSTDSAEELVRKYKIRFNGESHVDPGERSGWGI